MKIHLSSQNFNLSRATRQQICQALHIARSKYCKFTIILENFTFATIREFATSRIQQYCKISAGMEFM